MAVIDVVTGIDTLGMRLVARFDAPVEQVWRIWSDPRRLERWWGPPRYPATVSEHDLRPGGRVSYFMTGPGSERYHGWWRVLEMQAPVLHSEAGQGRPEHVAAAVACPYHRGGQVRGPAGWLTGSACARRVLGRGGPAGYLRIHFSRFVCGRSAQARAKACSASCPRHCSSAWSRPKLNPFSPAW